MSQPLRPPGGPPTSGPRPPGLRPIGPTAPDPGRDAAVAPPSGAGGGAAADRAAAPKPEGASREPPGRGPHFHQIDVLIRSKYPIIFIVTHEEERVDEVLRQVAEKQNKKLYSWSITRGLGLIGTGPTRRVSDQTRDPLLALDAVESNLENAIFIFRDLHPFMKDPTIIRRLRELAMFLRESPRSMVMIAPSLCMPCELEKEITVVEFGLPTPAEIERKIDEMIRNVGQRSQERIHLTPDDREKLVKAASGLTLREVESVLAKTIITRRKLDGEDLSAILAEKEQIIRKSGILEYYSAQEAFRHVGGLANLKDWLAKRAAAFSDRARQFGCPAPKGILLLGVQGCGKSLIAKAISSLWSVPLLKLDMGRIFSSLVGSSEENSRRAIKTAESVAPAILWVDEIEKAFSGVRSSNNSDAGTASRVFSTFLTWLQEKTSPVFVVATANDITQLPPELFRKGRFDEIFFVDLPEAPEREEIFQIHLEKRGRNPSQFDLAALAAGAEGFSGAEIEEAIIAALYDAFADGVDIDTGRVLAALQATFPLSQTMREQIEGLRQWAVHRARPAQGRRETDVGPGGFGRALELD